MEISASAASIFAQILTLKPPNLKISVHKTRLSEANISLQAINFGNPGCTPVPDKKLRKKMVPSKDLCRPMQSGQN